MTQTKRHQDLRRKIAFWLNDAFGDGGEVDLSWMRLAEDFQKFMMANGYEFRPTVMIVRGRKEFY